MIWGIIAAAVGGVLWGWTWVTPDNQAADVCEYGDPCWVSAQ